MGRSVPGTCCAERPHSLQQLCRAAPERGLCEQEAYLAPAQQDSYSRMCKARGACQNGTAQQLCWRCLPCRTSQSLAPQYSRQQVDASPPHPGLSKAPHRRRITEWPRHACQHALVSAQPYSPGAPTCHQIQALVRMQDLLQSQDVGVAAQNVQDGHLLLQQLEVLSIGALHRDEDCMRQAYPMRPWPVRSLVAARQRVGHGCSCGAASGQRASKGRPWLWPETGDAGSGCSRFEAAA